MAKALYGHFAHRDAALVWENARLRTRVAALEAEVERLVLEQAAGASEGATGFGSVEVHEGAAPERRPVLA